VVGLLGVWWFGFVFLVGPTFWLLLFGAGGGVGCVRCVLGWWVFGCGGGRVLVAFFWWACLAFYCWFGEFCCDLLFSAVIG